MNAGLPEQSSRPVATSASGEENKLLSHRGLTGVGIVAEGPRCSVIIRKRNPPEFPFPKGDFTGPPIGINLRIDTGKQQ